MNLTVLLDPGDPCIPHGFSSGDPTPWGEHFEVKPALPFQAFLVSVRQALPCRDSGPAEVLVEHQGGEWGHPVHAPGC